MTQASKSRHSERNEVKTKESFLDGLVAIILSSPKESFPNGLVAIILSSPKESFLDGLVAVILSSPKESFPNGYLHYNFLSKPRFFR